MGATSDKTVYKTLGYSGFGVGTIATAVDVKDDRITRIRPLRFFDKYTEEHARPWKMEVKGKALEPGNKTFITPLQFGYKNRVYSKNRILYPLKRVDWDPEGERNPQNRGISPYVRISWDEATTIIAKEIRRIVDTYGPTAVFCQGDGHGEEKTVGGGHGCNIRMMQLLGGCTIQSRNPDSWEGWYWGAKHAWGMDPVGQQKYQGNNILDTAENSDCILQWGCDPDTTPFGWGGMQASNICYWFTDIGVKQIWICPDLNYSAGIHADKWLPVLPNTDAALQLGIAYTWIKEGTFDQAYLDTHTIGFDHFKHYVMGGEDGIPKTPKWAEKKCGVPAHQIKALARYWAKHNVSIGHCNGGGMIRSVFSTEPARLEVTLLAMQALGHPGRNQVHMLEWGMYGMPHLNPMPHPDFEVSFYAGFTGHALGSNIENLIIQTLLPDAITNPPVKWSGHGIAGFPRADQFFEFTYPRPGSSRMHMFWTDTPCWSTCWTGGFRLQDALRDPSIEFMLVQHIWMENDCNFADIILPISTKLEQDDVASATQSGQFDLALYEDAAITPLGESKSDAEAVLAIAGKLGLHDEMLKQWYNLEEVGDENPEVAEAKAEQTVEGVLKADDDFDSLRVKLQKEAAALGKDISKGIAGLRDIAVRSSGLTGHIDAEEFAEKGYYVIPTKQDWKEFPHGMIDFYNDPESCPLDTPSGLIEIYCTDLAEVWPDDEERPPVPHWVEESPEHHERLTNDRGKDYPFLLMSNHPHFRVHAQNDDCAWLREIEMCKIKGPDGYAYEPVWINPIDARERNIKTGDIISVYNERGRVLGAALVTERIMRHTLSQDHGARCDTIVTGAGGLDRGGANNLIAPSATLSKNAPGEVTNGFLVNIEKVDVFELAKQYPEEFGRAYDPETGPVASARVIEEA